MKPFKNRTHAGELLAKELDQYARRPEAIVLALPRGGVPVGFAVSSALGLPLDVMLARKLGVPWHPELAMGAVTSNQLVVTPEVAQSLIISDDVIEAAAGRERLEIERRENLYRAGRPPLELQDHIVILVDDGLATGSTMLVAVQAVRKQNPARVIVAVPVGAPETCRKMTAEADEVICLEQPEEFYAVGLWYDDFTQTTDDEVIRLLNEAVQDQTQRSASMNASLDGSHSGGRRGPQRH